MSHGEKRQVSNTLFQDNNWLLIWRCMGHSHQVKILVILSSKLKNKNSKNLHVHAGSLTYAKSSLTFGYLTTHFALGDSGHFAMLLLLSPQNDVSK